jgi:histidine triad (HIT) family protein
LAFHDINPAAPKHVLVIPKGSYVTYDHFAQTATDDEITDFVRAIGEVCKILKVEPGQGGGGFRAISNAGEAGLQEVPHLHVHILGGRNLGPMVSKSQ